MILVADSSALIALALIDKLDLLDKLFGKVFVPKEVYNEVIKAEKPESHKLKYFLQDKIAELQHENYIISDFNITKGEFHAMLLYKSLNADLLMIDDKKAKKIAKMNNIKTIGSLGILLSAKEKGYLEEIKSSLETLRNSYIFLSDNLIVQVLKIAGE